MIDLDDLRHRLDRDDRIVLDRAEAMKVITELEAARKFADLPMDGQAGWALKAQREMTATLLVGLSTGISTERDAELVAGVVTQELAGLARNQVRAEGCRR